MTLFAVKLTVTVSLAVLLVVAISQIAIGIAPVVALLRSLELAVIFGVIVCIVGCLMS
ncbi:MAG: hypothetical protein ABID54_05460 [Pseudomonadota bacterium]